jgi:hypothetical protein
MSSSIIGRFPSRLEAVRRKIEESQLNALRELLPDSAIVQACRDAGHKFRRRLLTPVVTVFHMIAAALWPEKSFQAAWQASGCGHVDTGGLSRARKRLPFDVMARLFDRVADAAAALGEPFVAWRGHRVFNIDGACVSMEDNPELHAEFGTCNTKHGPGRYPLARIVVAAFMHTMTAVSYAIGGYRDSESALAEEVLSKLRPGDLIVGDRHFAGANLYGRYIARGLEFVTRKHQRLKVGRLKKLAKHGRGDFVTELPVNPKHRRADPSLPEKVRVRMIRVTASVRGTKATIWLVTSLLDPETYPAEEIARLYAGRWNIETLFRELKLTMGADVLRSKKPDGVRKEFAARMCAMNLVRTLMIEAALEHGEDPASLSFSNAVRATVATSLKMSEAPVWRLRGLYDELLAEIAAERVPDRPGRNEPRALTRERKHYPRLKVKRSDWRRRHAA